ncbi:MAG: hypothetical protein IKP29_06540, partial [Pseudobutyrivibrio sp.]|nr:hypothetical protein [Pseudobutyrivibrio sp.]
MGTKNRLIRVFHQMDGTVEFNNIRSKAQRVSLGYFPVSPLSFFKRVLSLTVVGCMLFTTRMNTLVSYASEANQNPVISKIDLDESIAVQKIYVGDTAESINFPNTLQATIDTYEEILVEVVEETPVEEVPVEEVPEAEEPVEETPAEEVPVSEEEPAQEVEPAAEETPVVGETPVVEESAPVEAAPVETAPAPAEEPTIIEEVIDGAFNIIFPAITVKAAELEDAESVEEVEEPEVSEEAKTTYKKETVKTSTTITLENVQWVIDAEQSTAAEFDSSVAGNTFVYMPVVETEYAVATALPTITVTIIEKEIEEVAFDAQAVIDGIVITVKADKGVFPEGATLSVKRPSSDQAEAAEEAVEEKEDAPLVEAYSFDISILNEGGLEIQPDNSKGKVTVSFALEEAANEDLNTEVYHMDEQVDGRFEAEKLDSTAVADTVTAETTGFSVYTVAITGGTVTFENDGYPYGKNMGSTPTLSIRVTNQDAKYQWQYSANKTSWTDIDGATSQDYSFTPTSGTWYRCKVNGAESKAVQMVKPGQDGRSWTKTKSNLSWYV